MQMSLSGDDDDSVEELQPVLAHGSCIGLYEVLANVPHTCTATADSMLQYFFIERTKVLAAFRTSYDVADFMWRVS